ncbi:MAG: type II toxin-antitoxin system PemK/MazF family toxin [Ilumatobacteraceae bacterium]
MIEPGDIYLADLDEERRRLVLVVSSSSFNRSSERALVAPEVFGEPDVVAFPWRVSVDDVVFAVDLLRTFPVSRLLDRTDRAPHGAMLMVRRAVLNIT